ncbi:hypothetical protein [Actinokineospora inagensis]|uniref:hypothetical protein n=1 Tax=Actinokineospora inagensis TaxID=103730 RepID=UPI00047AA907|nr:hypothetical protein [Actinokineospora inagensis]
MTGYDLRQHDFAAAPLRVGPSQLCTKLDPSYANPTFSALVIHAALDAALDTHDLTEEQDRRVIAGLC